MISHMEIKVKATEAENRMMVAVNWAWEKWGGVSKECQLSVIRGIRSEGVL